MNNFFKIPNNKSGHFYAIIISAVFVALSIIGISSYSFYLDDYSHSFSEMFRLQNINLIESSNVLELGTRLEATKKSGVVKCILAKSDGRVFYQLSNAVCGSGLFSRAVSIAANGRDNFTIMFEISLPWKVQIAFIGFLILNLLVFMVAYLWIISHENLKLKTQESLSLLTKQVAHDIRSPLSALNMVSSSLKEVSEEKRLLIKNAVQRINDIANDLLAKGKKIDSVASSSAKKKTSSKNKKVILLPALVDGLVSEKRIQFRDQINVRIESDFKNSFGSFVRAESKELLRLLSNLMNNSVESFFDNRGEVVIAVRAFKDIIQLSIKDNGWGIQPEILQKLGEAGISYGKEGTQSGSGLGIYHAKKTIEAIDGRFVVSSKVGTGTQIDIFLPRVEAPVWFLDSIILQPDSEIYCLDDDLTIHQIWKERLERLQALKNNIEIKSFTSAIEFKKFASAFHTGASQKKLFLLDYELLGQATSGLDVIEGLGLQENVVLVTSHYEEPEIQQQCEKLKIKLLPKSLAEFVPISVKIPVENMTAI